MVSSSDKEVRTRKAPAYALDRIRELASLRKVVYGGRRVELDIADNLHYSFEEVCQCLVSLQPQHFQHSKRYPNLPKWMDVYFLSWAPVGRKPDDLYIKLMLTRQTLTLTLCSFHWQQH